MPEGRLDQWVIIRQSEIGSRQSVVGDYAQRQFFYFYFTLKTTTNWGLASAGTYSKLRSTVLLRVVSEYTKLLGVVSDYTHVAANLPLANTSHTNLLPAIILEYYSEWYLRCCTDNVPEARLSPLSQDYHEYNPVFD